MLVENVKPRADWHSTFSKIMYTVSFKYIAEKKFSKILQNPNEQFEKTKIAEMQYI